MRAGFLGAGDETLTVVCVFKPIGVLRADPNGFASRHVCWELVKRSDPWKDSSKDMSESNSQPKSLILAQNERWRQA